MKSIIGIKDLEYYLADFLDDQTLSAICCVNRYYNDIFNDKFFLKRYKEKYKNFISGKSYKYIPKDINILLKQNSSIKKYYLQNQRYLNLKNQEEACLFAIYSDRADLLYLIFLKNNYQYSTWIDDIIPGSSERVGMTIQDHVIKADSKKCYKYVTTNNNDKYNIIFAITNKSNKITRYLFKIYEYNDIETEVYIFTCIQHDSPYLIDLYINNDKNLYSNRIISRIVWDNDIIKFTTKYNEALDLFISTLSGETLRQLKNLALQRNRFETIKLLTVYTSQFSTIRENK